jgi:hypothetical protein
VMRFSIAFRVAPLMPAMSFAPLEREDVSAPAELTSRSNRICPDGGLIGTCGLLLGKYYYTLAGTVGILDTLKSAPNNTQTQYRG